MRFSDFLLIDVLQGDEFIVGYKDDINIRIGAGDLFGSQVIGAGTEGFIPRFKQSNVLEDSSMYQNGDAIIFNGTISRGYYLDVYGDALGGIKASAPAGKKVFSFDGVEGEVFYMSGDAGAAITSSRKILVNNDLEANKFVKTGGTSGQFLKADGSVDSNTYATTSQLATATQNSSNWNAAYNDKINSAAVTGTTTKTITLTQQDGGTITASWTDISAGLSSIGISMPSAFTVANSPLTSDGVLSVTGAGSTSQYIRGDGSLATFPLLTGFVPYTGATANVNLGTHTLLAKDIVIDHSSGSGVAASITKNGSGEALTVVKGSGSGNAASITGGITLLSELNLTTKLADAHIASAVTWNAKQNALNGTGFVKANGTAISYDNNTYYLASNPNGYTSNLGTVTSVTASSPLFSSGGATPNLTIQQASGSQSGFLSSTDWSTFNNKVSVATLSGYVPTSRTLTINGTSFDLSVDRSWSIPVHNPVTLGTANGLSLSGQELSLGLASGSANGALSSANWTAFNNKIGGSGTTNYLAKFTASGTVGNSAVQEVSGNLGLGVTPSAWGVGTFGFDIGVGSAIYNPGSGNQTQILNNSYNNGTDFIYKNSSTAARYRMFGAEHQWFTAPSGTAGNAISFTQAMTLSANGNLLINTTTDAGFKLDVNGTGRFSGRLSVGGASNGLDGINLPNQNYIAWYLLGGTGSQNVAIRGNGNNLELSSGGGLTMTLDANQRLGIGTTSPSEKLHVSGNVLATAFFTSSDKRKKDIISQDGELAIYQFKGDDQIHYGYIAQDMQALYPNQVSKGTDGMLSLNYVEILVKKVHDLESKLKRHGLD
jgi:hypothetical protein